MGKDLTLPKSKDKTRIETRRFRDGAFNTAEEQTFFQLELSEDRMVAMKSLIPLEGTKLSQRYGIEVGLDGLLKHPMIPLKQDL